MKSRLGSWPAWHKKAWLLNRLHQNATGISGLLNFSEVGVFFFCIQSYRTKRLSGMGHFRSISISSEYYATTYGEIPLSYLTSSVKRLEQNPGEINQGSFPAMQATSCTDSWHWKPSLLDGYPVLPEGISASTFRKNFFLVEEVIWLITMCVFHLPLQQSLTMIVGRQITGNYWGTH